MEQYGYIAILLVFAIAFPVGGIIQSWLFEKIGARPSNPNPTKLETYECGVTTIGPSWIQFNFRYYYFALLFVIFDVEAVFLLPWAVQYKQLGLFGFVEMAVFMVILVLGYVYAWRKRALEWV